MPKLKKSLWDDTEDLQPGAFADPDAALIAELEPFLGSKAIKFIGRASRVRHGAGASPPRAVPRGQRRSRPSICMFFRLRSSSYCCAAAL